MTTVTTTEAKAHCRVTHTDEDSLFTIYVAAADDYIKNFCNIDTIPVRNAIKAAALLIIEDLYSHRGAKTDMQLYKNSAADDLLYPYRQNIGI